MNHQRKPKNPLKLGFCAIGKFVFSHEDAVKYKQALETHLATLDVTLVGLDDVLPDGMVRDQSHVRPVVEHFKSQGIDALFMPHCNFGTEGAAGMIAHHCKVPTLLWGPRDDAPEPDGTRRRDTLCGTLATSKVLHTLGVPFTYIPNTRINDDVFVQGLDRFLRAARVVKTMGNMRIALVGQRIDFFWSTIISEAALLQKFGVQVVPIDLTNLIDRVKKRAAAQRDQYENEKTEHEKWIEFRGHDDPQAILYNYAFRDELLDLAREQDIDGFAVQTFDAIPNELGMFPSLGVAMVNDLGYPVACESDVHGAVTSVLLEAASGKDEPCFFPDITSRHPDNDNAVLLWHIEAPLSLRDAKASVRTGLPWILKGLPPGLLHFKLKDGPVTLARFDGDETHGYRLGCGEGKTVDGPYTQEYYAWLEVDDWQAWETQLVRGPYIHHCSCVFDHCTEVLHEACRYLPDLTFEPFGKTVDRNF